MIIIRAFGVKICSSARKVDWPSVRAPPGVIAEPSDNGTRYIWRAWFPIFFGPENSHNVQPHDCWQRSVSPVVHRRRGEIYTSTPNSTFNSDNLFDRAFPPNILFPLPSSSKTSAWDMRAFISCRMLSAFGVSDVWLILKRVGWEDWATPEIYI